MENKKNNSEMLTGYHSQNRYQTNLDTYIDEDGYEVPNTVYFYKTKNNAEFMGDYTYKCRLNFNSPFILDCKNNGWNELKNILTNDWVKKIKDMGHDVQGFGVTTDFIVQYFSEYDDNYDSVIFKNIREGWDHSIPLDDVYVSLNPKNFKILEIYDSETKETLFSAVDNN